MEQARDIEISYIKEAIVKMEQAIEKLDAKLDLYTASFAKKDDIRAEMDRLEKKIDLKVDKEEFQPIKSGINTIIMVIVIAVIGGLLAVIGIKHL